MAEISSLGKYSIRRELGRGAMGVVYEGVDPVIERTVAIKTIRGDQFEPSQMSEMLARFKREAQAAGRLNHPHIVAIYEYGEDVAAADPDATVGAAQARVAFIAMEYIKGRELKDYFDESRRFAMKEIERIMSELLDALGHAHQHGVTHRDMKPANVILLEGSNAVKVADFGIARIESSELTQAGTVLGTPSYMSPEQFLGQTVDGRSDLFSCGVILYQFLTGEKPFTGAVTTIMHKVLKEEPLAPSMLNATLPPAWDAVIRKAMAKNPDERYQNAAEFKQAVRDVIAGKAPAAEATMIDLGDATVAAGVADATVAGATTRSQPAPQRPAPASFAPSAPSPGKNSGLMYAAIAAAIIVVGGGAYLALSGKNEAPRTASVPAPSATNAPAAPAAAAPTPAPVAPAEPPPEPGTLVSSALGIADPAKFSGDAAAAGAEARADAKRQLIEKALALIRAAGFPQQELRLGRAKHAFAFG